ncbi:hypothetical protein [Metapseudomonas otitidis]|uniref:hypothetical protein n=1 Tax=Metapseudomonas otitidis TaxID=319939 RepID=UPI0013F63A7A|nr:hypothetical protein [Pseudomonas otitidis]
MLEVMASPVSVVWVSLALVGLGVVMLLSQLFTGEQARASAICLICGVLAVLCSGYYLVFVWASHALRALPGLVLGIPLIYVGSVGVLRSRTRPAAAAGLLAGALAILLLFDAQRLWPAMFYRVYAVVMGHPDLVLHNGDDLKDHVPQPGTRLIFHPTEQQLSCGLLANPDAVAPKLPVDVDCRNVYWGKEMISPKHQIFTDLSELYGLEDLWWEVTEGHYRSSLVGTLTDTALLDFQRLCPQEQDCRSGKGALAKVLGHERWSDALEWAVANADKVAAVYEALPSHEHQTLLVVIAEDVKRQLEPRVEGLVAAYADAQRHSLALYDLMPSYSIWDNWSLDPYNSLEVWRKLISGLSSLTVDLSGMGTLSYLQDAVLVEVQQSSDGGTRLIYHTGVGRQATMTLVIYALPLLWLGLVCAILLWRCFITFRHPAADHSGPIRKVLP